MHRATNNRTINNWWSISAARWSKYSFLCYYRKGKKSVAIYLLVRLKLFMKKTHLWTFWQLIWGLSFFDASGQKKGQARIASSIKVVDLQNMLLWIPCTLLPNATGIHLILTRWDYGGGSFAMQEMNCAVTLAPSDLLETNFVKGSYLSEKLIFVKFDNVRELAAIAF